MTAMIEKNPRRFYLGGVLLHCCRVCEATWEPTPYQVARKQYICSACKVVYERERRARNRPTLTQRILAMHEPVPEAGCWLWTGSLWSNGYGKAPSGRRGYSQLAHRVYFQALVGPIPDGFLVCHRCDTPPCCNPDHLFLGRQLENNRDRTAKGRGWDAGQWSRRRIREAAARRIANARHD